jgi:hypothetical protein
MEDRIVAEYDDDDAWNLGYGEDGYVGSWDANEGDEFVDALCALVMKRARRAARRR